MGSQPVCVIYFLFMVWQTKKTFGSAPRGCTCVGGLTHLLQLELSIPQAASELLG